MKLSCRVIVVDLNLRAKENKFSSRPLKGIVSIGFRSSTKTNDKNSVPLILVATVLDKNGHKFLIEENIERIFEKFTKDGKCTLRFKEPNKDVMISDADPSDLKAFLQIVRSVLKKESSQLKILLPAEKEDVTAKQLKMTIRKREDYPLTKSFPPSLQELIIESTCSLKRIDTRIFSLKNLVRLSISNQQIVEIPRSIGSTKLMHLNLSGNKIATFPNLEEASIVHSLRSIDLSNNRIHTITPTFFKMTKLTELRISHNLIAELPFELALLPFLKEVKASDNLLKFLPSSFCRRRFKQLDLYGNPLTSVRGVPNVSIPSEEISNDVRNLFFMSLYEFRKLLSQKNVVSYKFLQDYLPRHLISMLERCEQCICGSFAYNAKEIIKHVEMSKFCETVISVDNLGTTTVPMSFIVCSGSCERKLQNYTRAWCCIDLCPWQI